MGKQETEKCDDCENGRWYDASHGCSRTCNKCEGTGQMPKRNHEVDRHEDDTDNWW